MKILIAEDDLNIREGLKDLLSREGYEILAAENGCIAVELFQQNQPDFVILDIMMPEMDGYAVCREIRKQDNDIPIIFLSAKSEEIDRVIGLELGADDYISKPFGTREIIARIRAITRRYLKTQPQIILQDQFKFGDLTVYPNELRAKRGDQSIDLSLREIKILKQLAEHKGEVLSRDYLFNTCWGYDYMPNSRTLDQHISKLRKLIEHNATDPQLIKTVRGAGYRYE
ncbi:MAG TPA: response regulator transcription factor [Leucothrix mucor]|uniref:Response regulator transcription factor n=1 Tax=Leucothrix mucor TaxID=45248 RepID=A0A7V2WU57_LEUMU|nr:response regulator transcription factor [Leucothrix mucor]